MQFKPFSATGLPKRRLLSATIAFIAANGALAQEQTTQNSPAQEEAVEEVVVVGSQIRGAKINEALSVNVLDADAISELGVESMEDLLDMLPENGNNFFNEAENISGGVNSARGDIAAYNLRGLGTGNTLVLLNGRRMVNSATYQTEEVGGGFVPVNTVNANSIAPNSLARVEVLRDGASAIYGADAVAGVINNVIDTDFEGFEVNVRYTDYESLPRDDQRFSVKWGTTFNDGATHLATFFNYYQRDRVNSQDDPRWATSDFRDRIPADSPWAGDTRFRNDSANSLFGQFDMSGSIPGFTDSRGEFETYPAGDPRCQYDIVPGVICGAPDGQGTYRYNLNENRDLASELSRANLTLSLTHDFSNGLSAYTEVLAYQSDTNTFRHPTASFSSSKLTVGADNPYNPFPGKDLLIDNYRFAELPRVVDNDGYSYRFLQGLQGSMGAWDWDTAVTYSLANKYDLTHNRVSNTLMQEALLDTSMNAYNPFNGGVDTNIERALISVYRDSTTTLATADFKISNNAIFTLPAGDVGMVVGAEVRRESFEDDRDPRLDGTIQFTDGDGDTFPFVSDVVNSSPTPDNEGSRVVSSLFTELQVPVFEGFDVQLAVRYENFSDVGDTVVGKAAFGYVPTDWLMVRGSWSEAFRAPNLVTVNEEIVARSGTYTDYACEYAANNGGDPDQNTLDCRNSIQRTAGGSDDLTAEKSENTSFGLVLTPVEGLDITWDYWKIDKTDTIGLFGNENHTVLDLLERIEAGTSNCAGSSFNSALDRAAVTPEEAAIYNAAGICPAGVLERVNDSYANLDQRITEGWDLGIYYGVETDFGDFNFRYNLSKLERYDQVAGGDSLRLVQAQQAGVLPASIPIDGFDDLIGRDGNQEERSFWQLRWRKDWISASLQGNTIGEFYQSSLTLDDGTRYVVPEMTTYDASVTGYFDTGSYQNRIRFGVKNLTDERAPLADRYFGFFADAHKDFGRHMYIDYKLSF